MGIIIINYYNMKTHTSVSSQRRKSRKAHFTAPSNIRRRMMSCLLSKELRTKYDCRSVPVRKGDTVAIKRGSVEDGVRDKKNGSQVPIPIQASNCEITALKLDKSRKELLKRRNKSAKASGADQMD